MRRLIFGAGNKCHLDFVQPFDASRLTVSRAMVQPVQRFFQMCNCETVLTAAELAFVVELEAVNTGSDNGLHESPVWRQAITIPAERPILPNDIQPESGYVPA